MGTPRFDGEGNLVGSTPFWEESEPVSMRLTRGNAWAEAKAAQLFGPYWASYDPFWLTATGVGGPPNNYDWIVIGEYGMPSRRARIFAPLQDYAARAGLGPIDWTPYLALAARDHWARYNQPFRWLESPHAGVIIPAVGYAAIEHPQLVPFIADAEALWPQALAEQQARLAKHKAIDSSLKTIAWSAVGAFVGAAALAGSSGAGAAGATAAEEAAALGIAETGGTAVAASSTSTVAAATLTEEAAALGIAEVAAPAAAPVAGAGAVGSAIDAAAKGVIGFAQSVGKAILGTAAAKVVSELGPDAPDAPAPQPAPAGGLGLVHLAALGVAAFLAVKG